MTDRIIILLLTLALAAGLVTAFLASLLLRNRRTEFFRYFLANILLFNLLILSALFWRYLTGDGRGPGLVLLAVLSVMKVAWVSVFALMMRALSGAGEDGRFRSRLWWVAGTVLVVHAVAAGIGLIDAAVISLELLVVGGAMAASLQLMIRAVRTPSRPRRVSLTVFASIHMAVLLAVTGSMVASWVRPAGQTGVHTLVNSVLLMAYNLIPLVWIYRFQPVGPASRPGKGERYGISAREREIIEMVCEGRTNQEIADALFISLATVKDHNYNIFRKTGVRNRVELANLFRSDD